MRVAVIGGGISGIASVFYLQQHHVEVDLYESEARIGGRASSELLLGQRVDLGGKNIGKHYDRFRSFAKTLGNPDFEYFGINTSLLTNGKIVGVSRDGSTVSYFLKLARLCGLNGIRKLYPLVSAVLKDRRQGALGSDYFRKISERYDHLTLNQYLDGPCIANIIRPATIRMNGAEPDECYPGNLGSNLTVALDSYEQLTNGLHALLEKFRTMYLPGTLRILQEHQVISLSQNKESGGIDIEYRHGDKSGTAHYDQVISALPAGAFAELLRPILPEAAALLDTIRYYPVSIAICRYRNAVFHNRRRAMVFDASSPLSNAGAYGINDLETVRYTFSGRVSRSAVSESSPPETVVELGEQIASPYFNIRGNPREGFVYRHFSKGLCAYSPRHHLLLDVLDSKTDQIQGLTATGDYRRGASIEACFMAAEECVQKIIRKPQ